jgi:hypothetical protein
MLHVGTMTLGDDTAEGVVALGVVLGASVGLAAHKRDTH